MIGIGLALHFKDYFTDQSNRARNSFNALYNDADLAQKKLIDNVEKIRNFSTIGAYAGARMISGMGKMIAEGADFGQQMLNIQANMGGTAEEMDKIKKGSLEMSRQFKLLPEDVAIATKEMLKAGATLQNAGQATRAALGLSIIGETDLAGDAGAIDVLVAGLSIFEKSLDEADSLVNKIARTANRTTVDVKDLGESFKYGGTEAHRMGISIEEYLALQGMIGQAGYKGSMAGTVSSNFMRYFADLVGDNPSAKALKTANALGLVRSKLIDILYTDPKKGGGLLGVLKQLRTGFSGLDPVSKMNAANDIFQVRGSRALTILDQLDKSNFGESYVSLLKAIETSTAEDVLKQIEKRNSGTAASTRDLAASFQEFYIAFEEAVRPVIQPLLDGLTSIVRGLAAFGTTSIGKFVFTLTAFAVVLGTVALGINAIVFALSAFKLAGAGLGLMGAFKLTWLTTLASSAASLVGWFTSLGSITARITGAVTALGTAISWPVLAIGAIVGVLIGFENMLNLTMWALKSFANTLMHPLEAVDSWLGLSGNTDTEYANRQRDLDSFYGQKITNPQSQVSIIGQNTRNNAQYNPYLQGELSGFKQSNPQLYDKDGKMMELTINNQIEGGETISKKTQAKIDEDILNLIVW